MSESVSSELLEKVRQQFDTAPYPEKPLDHSPSDAFNFLFVHSLATPFYLRDQRVVSTAGKVILDAGCGSGYKALALAIANPNSQIVGIDLSEKSVEIARQRLAFQGFTNAEFHTLAIEDLPNLGLTFDYINCDEVLYLLPEALVGLQAMKAVLKPSGILRANLHSALQRMFYYRAQTIFRKLGLMDQNPGAEEIDQVRVMFQTLRDDTVLKRNTWSEQWVNDLEYQRANFLLQGDRGITIPELFNLLQAADLEFVSMVNWRHWQLPGLFQQPDHLPTLLAQALPHLSQAQQLQLYELLHPTHRLLNFWCTHPGQTQSVSTLSTWTEADWQAARVHLHPCLQAEKIKADLLAALAGQQSFPLGQYLYYATNTDLSLESHLAACLLPLWDGPQAIATLIDRYHQLHAVDPITLEPVTLEQATQQIQRLLTQLEQSLYVLIEKAG